MKKQYTLFWISFAVVFGLLVFGSLYFSWLDLFSRDRTFTTSSFTVFAVNLTLLYIYSIYSYFEKGCRIKCTRQPRNISWVVLSSLFFKEIWNNGRRSEAMDVWLRVLKESNKSRFGSYNVRNSVLIISHVTFRDCRVHIFSDNLSRNICIRKGNDFASWSILKGREICHLGLLKGPIGLIDEWCGFEKSRKRSVFKIACSQTLYFLFKVRRARVIKYKLQGLYWPPVQGGRNEKKNETTSVYRLCLRLTSM